MLKKFFVIDDHASSPSHPKTSASGPQGETKVTLSEDRKAKVESPPKSADQQAVLVVADVSADWTTDNLRVTDDVVEAELIASPTNMAAAPPSLNEPEIAAASAVVDEPVVHVPSLQAGLLQLANYDHEHHAFGASGNDRGSPGCSATTPPLTPPPHFEVDGGQPPEVTSSYVAAVVPQKDAAPAGGGAPEVRRKTGGEIQLKGSVPSSSSGAAGAKKDKKRAAPSPTSPPTAETGSSTLPAGYIGASRSQSSLQSAAVSAEIETVKQDTVPVASASLQQPVSGSLEVRAQMDEPEIVTSEEGMVEQLEAEAPIVQDEAPKVCVSATNPTATVAAIAAEGDEQVSGGAVLSSTEAGPGVTGVAVTGGTSSVAAASAKRSAAKDDKKGKVSPYVTKDDVK